MSPATPWKPISKAPIVVARSVPRCSCLHHSVPEWPNVPLLQLSPWDPSPRSAVVAQLPWYFGKQLLLQHPPFYHRKVYIHIYIQYIPKMVWKFKLVSKFQWNQASMFCFSSKHGRCDAWHRLWEKLSFRRAKATMGHVRRTMRPQGGPIPS